MPLGATSRIAGRISASQLRFGIEPTFMGPRHGARRGRGQEALAPTGRSDARGKIVEDGTVRPVVAMAFVNKPAQRLRHNLHVRDARLEIGDVRPGDAPDFAAWTVPVARQGQKGADFRRRKAEPPRSLDELELVDLAFAVVAIVVLSAFCGRQKADRLVAPDHLGRHSARRCRGADVHGRSSGLPCDNRCLDLPMVGRFRPTPSSLQGSPSMSLIEAESAMAKDPVCGMSVDPASAQYRLERDGTRYYFCCAGCRDKFAADPERYLAPKAEASPPKAAPAGTIYTCPMHPQIRQVGPGNCPICGMALEPEMATAETGPSAELIDMTRRFWIGLVLTVPVIALEMGGHLTNLHMWLPPETSNWIQLVLATPRS